MRHRFAVPPPGTGVELVGIVEACGSGVEGFEMESAVATMTASARYRGWQIGTPRHGHCRAGGVASDTRTDSETIVPLADATDFNGLESVADAAEHLLAGKNPGKVIADLR